MLARSSLLPLFFFLGSAVAQTMQPTGVPPSLEVTRLAPQLLTFAGSQANLDSLVTSLSSGTTATLTSTLTDGSSQLVTFTPASAGLTPTQIAQTLEQARQQLIGRGIAAPSAQQIGVTLLGGALPTPNGVVQVNGLAPVANAAAGGSAFSSPLTVQTRPAAPAGTAGTTAGVGATAASPTARPNISDSPFPRGISDSPPAQNNQAVAPAGINAPQQPMVTPPAGPATGARGFR